MASFSDDDLRQLADDAWEIVLTPAFQDAAAARRPDGVFGEIGTRLDDRYVLSDVAGNVFVKETYRTGVRLGFVPATLLQHVREGKPRATYDGPKDHRVRVWVERPVEGEARVPYAWTFVASRVAWAETPTGSRAALTQPRIDVSAAPGVFVDLGVSPGLIGDIVRWPPAARAAEDRVVVVGRGTIRTAVARRDVAVGVRRVQSAALLPAPDGTPTRAAEAFDSVQAEERLSTAVIRETPFHQVAHRADGLDLTLFPRAPRELLAPPFELPEAEPTTREWVQQSAEVVARWGRQILGLRPRELEPMTIQIRVPVESDGDRFAWAVSEEGGSWTVEIDRTAGVRVELVEGLPYLDHFGSWVDYRERVVAFEDAGVVGRGVALDTERAPRAGVPTAWVLGAELAMGFTPVVGELADLADLLFYQRFGTDKWGQAMTRADVALVVAGLAAAGVSAGGLRAAYRFGRNLPDEIGAATEALSAAERRVLDTLTSDFEAVRIGTGGASSATLGSGWKGLLAHQIMGKLSRLLGAQVAFPARKYAFSDFVNHADDGFVVPDLQRAYAAYLGGAPGSPLPPRAWLGAEAPQALRDTVQTLMGRRAFDVETAPTADLYVAALRREQADRLAEAARAARAAGGADPAPFPGPPRGEIGRGWPWDRFGTPDDYDGYVWRHGDPVDAPRPSARDYPPYGEAKARAWKNAAYYELQHALGRVLDPPPSADEMWRLCRDAGLLDRARRPTHLGDDAYTASVAELVEMYGSGRAQVADRAYQAGWQRTAPPSRAPLRAMELARLELQRRFGDTVASGTPAQIRARLDRVSQGPPAGSARGYEDLSDDDLLRTIELKISPFAEKVLEFEHDVPQRATRRLEAALHIDGGDARRLTLAGSPDNLFGVNRLEHGFFDGEVRAASRPFDDRLGNPFVRLRSAELRELLALVHDPSVRVKSRAGFDELVGWLDAAAQARGLTP